MKYKGLVYKKIKRTRTCEFFECQVCTEKRIALEFYRSINLCYICKECGEKILKLTKDCKGCEALNFRIYNNFGVYYCWEKEGRFIFEGDENLPIPTPEWCPKKKGGGKVVKRKCEDTQDIKSEWR